MLLNEGFLEVAMWIQMTSESTEGSLVSVLESYFSDPSLLLFLWRQATTQTLLKGELWEGLRSTQDPEAGGL